MVTEVRPVVIRVMIGVLIVAAIVAASASATGSPYPRLVDRHGFRVYGPPTRPNVPCPRVLALPPHALRIARRAVALAMPAFEARLKLNGRDPIVSVVPAARTRIRPYGDCRRAWRRSIVASVRLPHIHSASMSAHTFAVARIGAGWVLWAWLNDASP
jgi:hypothetical protein